MTLTPEQTAVLELLTRHDALDVAEACGLTEYEGGILRSRTHGDKVERIARQPSDWVRPVGEVRSA